MEPFVVTNSSLYLGSVLTHYAFIPTNVELGQYIMFYALELLLLNLGILASLMYHMCQMFVYHAQCIFPYAQTAFIDHITAEDAMLVVIVNFTKPPSLAMRWFLVILITITLVIYKLLTDTPYWTAGWVLVGFVYGAFYNVYEPVSLMIGLTLALTGMLLYFIENYVQKQIVVHDFWHICIYLSMPFIFRSLYPSPDTNPPPMSVVNAIRWYMRKNKGYHHYYQRHTFVRY